MMERKGFLVSQTIEPKMRWSSLAEAYRRFGLVLCFGAGISHDCKLPTWNVLLERLAERWLADDTKRDLLERTLRHETPARQGSATPFIDGLRSLGLSLPAIASLLQQNAVEENITTPRQAFLDGIVNALYQDLYLRFDGLSRGDDEAERRMAEWIRMCNPTLAAVAALSVVKSKSGFLPNPRIPAIINFNLDGLFRKYSRTAYGHQLFKTIERANKEVPRQLTRYYHPHGYIPLKKTADHARDLVVFTEQDYFDFFSEPTGIFTYTLLSLLREYPVLFVGLSFQDDNLRRLLHYSLKERQTHLRQDPGFMRRDPRYKQSEEKRLTRHYAILKGQNGELDQLVEQSLLMLGVQPLFLDRFADLPEKLKDVYGVEWESVYQRVNTKAPGTHSC